MLKEDLTHYIIRDNFYLDEVVKFLNSLKKDLDATLSYIENENIPKTNNWLELYFNIVYPKKISKKI